MHIAEEAARKCITHYRQASIYSPEFDGSLISYFTSWIARDEGIEAVNGSYEVFIQTALVVIYEWLKDPSLLDYRMVRSDGRLWRRKRRPPLIFEDRREDLSRMIDKAVFNYALARYRHRQKS